MKVLTLIAALTLSTSIQAEESKSGDMCESVEGLARTIMTQRQKGASLLKMMKLSEIAVSRLLIKKAFEESRYNTKSIQDRIINEFANNWYAACLSNEAKDK